MRIRWQSFVDPGQHGEYFELLRAYLDRSAGDGVSFDLAGITPPAPELHRLGEARYGIRAVANAIAAEGEGFDAYVIGHFQDSGLFDARSAVRIPVLGLGQTAMLHACTLGQRIGLVAIGPVFVPVHREQIARYGLGERVVGVTALDGLAVDDYVSACTDDETLARVVERLEQAVRPLLQADVEVIVPAGGLLAMALSRQPDLEVGGAAVLNPIPVLAKHAEAAVALAGLGMPVASRTGTFALASDRSRQEFFNDNR